MSQITEASRGALTQMGNLNAYAFSFDDSILGRLRTVYAAEVAGNLDAAYAAIRRGSNYAIRQGGHEFHVTNYDENLLWVSSNNAATYEVFSECFDALNIAEGLKRLVDHDEKIVMYCGFFVVSYQMTEPSWHVDYFENANAYTLLTPLFELDADQGNLLYRNEQGSIDRYRYRTGQGLLIGEQFLHATEPYPRTPKARVLLSMTAGTDKMTHWKALSRTAGNQSEFLMLPCGHVRGSCGCLA
jgi:hypothetical protein